MAKREITERNNGELTVEAGPSRPKVADVRRDLDAALSCRRSSRRWSGATARRNRSTRPSTAVCSTRLSVGATIEQTVPAARANLGSANLRRAHQSGRARRVTGLTAGLSRREIGAQLYISVDTVKSHLRELYRKPGATSQTEAVTRADTFGVLDPGQSPG